MKKATKATAKKLVRKHASDLATETVEDYRGEPAPKIVIDSETITIWGSGKREEKAASAIASDLGATVLSNGSKFDIYYRAQPLDMGEWCDPSSRWHY